jgi:hypothetical protein
MKKFIVTLLCGVIIPVAFFLVWKPSQERITLSAVPYDSNKTLEATSTVVVPDPLTLDVYPASQLLEVDNRSDFIWRRTSYRVDVTKDKVLNFYKRTLLGAGWTLVKDGVTPIYTWTEDSGSIPWDLTLTITIQVFENLDTGYDLLVYRSPDIDDLPLYDGSGHLEEYTTRDPLSGAESQNITYLVRASPGQVEAFYRDKLPNMAWTYNTDSKSITSQTGLLFSAGYRPNIITPDMRTSLALSIFARPRHNGETLVQLIVRKINISLNP